MFGEETLNLLLGADQKFTFDYALQSDVAFIGRRAAFDTEESALDAAVAAAANPNTAAATTATDASPVQSLKARYARLRTCEEHLGKNLWPAEDQEGEKGGDGDSDSGDDAKAAALAAAVASSYPFGIPGAATTNAVRAMEAGLLAELESERRAAAAALSATTTGGGGGALGLGGTAAGTGMVGLMTPTTATATAAAASHHKKDGNDIDSGGENKDTTGGGDRRAPHGFRAISEAYLSAVFPLSVELLRLNLEGAAGLDGPTIEGKVLGPLFDDPLVIRLIGYPPQRGLAELTQLALRQAQDNVRRRPVGGGGGGGGNGDGGNGGGGPVPEFSVTEEVAPTGKRKGKRGKQPTPEELSAAAWVAQFEGDVAAEQARLVAEWRSGNTGVSLAAVATGQLR